MGYTQTSSSSGKKIQEEKIKEQERFINKLVVGGNLSIDVLSRNIIELSIAPKVGYAITDNFFAGIGLGYFYSLHKKNFLINNTYGGFKYEDRKISMLSPSLWAQYKVFHHYLLHAEFQINSFKYPKLRTEGNLTDAEGWRIIDYEQISSPSLFLGGGINYPIYKRNSVFMLFLYDVLHESNTQKGQAIFNSGFDIRVGFHIGL